MATLLEANGGAEAGAGLGLGLGIDELPFPVLIGRFRAAERRGLGRRSWAAAARVELTGSEWWHGDMSFFHSREQCDLGKLVEGLPEAMDGQNMVDGVGGATWSCSGGFPWQGQARGFRASPE